MSLLNLIRNEFRAALDELNRPFFHEGSNHDYFYSELFSYYHALQGKTIDSSNGESLFPVVADTSPSHRGVQLRITKTVNSKLSDAAVASEIGSWHCEPV